MSRHLTDVSFPFSPDGNPSVDSDFSAALARCALGWHQQPDEAATTAAITASTLRLMHGADAAAVVTVSGSGELQIRAAEGPIEKLHAVLPRALTPSRWTSLPSSLPASPPDRWPVSATLDHHAEMGSMLCAPLGHGRMMFGTLLVLGFATDAFTSRSTTDATTLAIHASIALAVHRQRGQWEDAVASRDVIGQAKGILMHQRQLTAPQAFAYLRDASQHRNIKLRQLAETLCRSGELLDRSPASDLPDQLEP